ncbi:HET-C-related protein [Pseudomonas huanghezhanensis]|uniref:HET-C-related protein n=1 Tax=Pseudomonas huanghezhanensis TaxID=3002903 RepID=UPI002286BA1C|nr:HET-C-related protein [Pseudomonas sp. BSw22131]
MSFQALAIKQTPLTDQPLHSTFALETLTQVAKAQGPDAFTSLIQQIFGSDIEPHTCAKLRTLLLAGEVQNPTITLTESLGYDADYDNRERTIRIDWGFYLRTAQGPNAHWLMDALLHEFGHHIDNLLRRDLCDLNEHSAPLVDGDAAGEEGERFSYWMARIGQHADDEFTIARPVKTGAYTHEIQANWKEAAARIQARYNERHGHYDASHSHPDREPFEAGEGDDHKRTHQQIETVLIGLGFDRDETHMVYFGNWLRDYSQLLDPKIVRATTMPKNFPDVLSRDALTRIVDVMAVKHFRLRRHFPEHFTVSPQMLGVYRPTEHIDNPKVSDPQASEPTLRDKDFEPLVRDGNPLLDVDYETSMKRYMAQSVTFMQAELKIAMQERSVSNLRAFGSALHVLEDFFAHSNFVELSLIKNGHTDVVAWTSPAPCKAGIPLVTGMFGPTDVLASLAGPLGEILFSTEDVTYMPVKAGDRSPREQVLLILLEEHHNPSYLEAFNTYLTTRDEWVDLPFVEFLQRCAQYLLGLSSVVGNGVGIIMKDLLTHLGENVDDWQTRYGQDPHLNGSTDPTHSQLAKDHAEHPLHLLAASLASDAVKQVAQAMTDYWNGDTSADPIAVATAYFKHPQDCDWQDAPVITWAAANPEALRRSQSKTELAEISKTLARSGSRALEQLRKDSTAYLTFLRGEFLDANSPIWFLNSLTPLGQLSKGALKYLKLI